jgi:hypothetical protein
MDRHGKTFPRPSHGENRGSSPLGSASNINELAKVYCWPKASDQRSPKDRKGAALARRGPPDTISPPGAPGAGSIGKLCRRRRGQAPVGLGAPMAGRPATATGGPWSPPSAAVPCGRPIPATGARSCRCARSVSREPRKHSSTTAASCGYSKRVARNQVCAAVCAR